jgi:hypothetical protein
VPIPITTSSQTISSISPYPSPSSSFLTCKFTIKSQFSNLSLLCRINSPQPNHKITNITKQSPHLLCSHIQLIHGCPIPITKPLISLIQPRTHSAPPHHRSLSKTAVPMPNINLTHSINHEAREFSLYRCKPATHRAHKDQLSTAISPPANTPITAAQTHQAQPQFDPGRALPSISCPEPAPLAPLSPPLRRASAPESRLDPKPDIQFRASSSQPPSDFQTPRLRARSHPPFSL